MPAILLILFAIIVLAVCFFAAKRFKETLEERDRLRAALETLWILKGSLRVDHTRIIAEALEGKVAE